MERHAGEAAHEELALPARVGVPEIGVGSNCPFRTMRSRPGFSVTNMSPAGRNARLHGFWRPVTTGATRICSVGE
jgi:hypothetical protein